jgi:hypothetical protein
MTPRTKIILSALGGVLVVGLLTYRSTLDHRSCVGCRGFSYITARSVFGIQVWRSERLQITSDIPAGHVHDWWRYSLHTSTAISTKFACKRFRFADNGDE